MSGDWIDGCGFLFFSNPVTTGIIMAQPLPQDAASASGTAWHQGDQGSIRCLTQLGISRGAAAFHLLGGVEMGFPSGGVLVSVCSRPLSRRGNPWRLACASSHVVNGSAMADCRPPTWSHPTRIQEIDARSTDRIVKCKQILRK